MKRRNFVRIAGGGVVMAAAVSAMGLTSCSSAMPPEAIEAWRGPAADAAPGARGARAYRGSYSAGGPDAAVDRRSPRSALIP